MQDTRRRFLYPLRLCQLFCLTIGRVTSVKNVIERPVIFTKDEIIGCENLTNDLLQDKGIFLNKLGREELETILCQNKYNISKTARELRWLGIHYISVLVYWELRSKRPNNIDIIHNRARGLC